MLFVVVQQRAAELDHLEDARIGEAVVDGAVLSAGLDEAAPTQAGEVVGDLRLGLIEQGDELADRALLLGDELKYAQPRAVAEHAEVLGEQVGLDGLGGEPEWGVGHRGVHDDDDITSDSEVRTLWYEVWSGPGASIEMTQIDICALADQLVAARPVLNGQQQRIGIALYRLLAEGQPVGVERLAGRAGASLRAVEGLFDEEPGIYRDERGRVVGFWGLALGGTPHRLTVNGRELSTWCAWDALFLPELLGETAAVASTCPTTGERVELVVAPAGVREVSPAGAVLSFQRRERPFDADSIKTFCRFVHFFASPEAAMAWTTQHPGTFVLSIGGGAEIARRVNHATFEAVLS